MKKLVKVTALLLVAAAMFAGCKNNVEEEPAKDAPLFSKDDVSIAANSIEWSNGDWIASAKMTVKGDASKIGSPYSGTIDGSEFEKAEFTIAGNDVTFTYAYQKLYQSITLDHDPTEAEIASLKEEGLKVDGRVATQEVEGDAPKSELDSMTLNDIETMASRVSLKTNEDHTKYFGEISGSSTDFTSSIEVYIMKK